MTLLYKPDWPEAKKRLTAWWDCELYGGRPAIQIQAPRDEPLPHGPRPPDPDSPEQRWLDVEWRLARAEHTFAHTAYLGEAFPHFGTDIGPGSLALHLGSPATLQTNTVWYEPCLESLADTEVIRRDPEEPFWQVTMELVGEGIRRGEGKYLTSVPDLIENLDILASLRGNEELLVDLSDAPEHVHRLLPQIQRHWFDVFDIVYDRIRDEDEGCCFIAFQIWGPGKTAKLQSDVSYMLSPEMFREFAMPGFREQTKWLDYSLYHWDGPGAIPHLDALLELPDLNAIQWVPGAGNPPVHDSEWFPLYRRIREAGKGLLFTGARADTLEMLYKEFGPEGAMAACSVESEAEGQRLLEQSATWL
ncbi:MAG: hypothetical protein PVH68_01520 [Armatimonadota bacterium]